MPANFRDVRAGVSRLQQQARENPIEEDEAFLRLIECPPDLQGAAAEAWKRLAPMLGKKGLYVEQDRDTLRTYCELWDEYRSAKEQMDAFGITYYDDDGKLRRNPAVAIANDARRLMRYYMIEFGMTPASRARVEPPPSKRKDAGGPPKYTRSNSAQNGNGASLRGVEELSESVADSFFDVM